MSRLLLASLLAVSSLSTLATAAPDDSWMVLQKASQAARELSYQGVFTYQSGPVAKSVQITHMNYGQGEYARMLVLDGNPREVLSQGNDVVIFNPKNEKVIIEKRRGQNMFPALLPANLELVKNSYQVRMGGVERVGGRDGQVILLEPRDHFRYGYKLWADRQYGLLLKAMTTNERNEPMEQMAFNQLTMMNTQNMDWFQPNVDPHKAYVMEQAAPSKLPPQVEDWLIGAIPAGYLKVEQMQRMVPGKTKPVTHLIYSDGLASVSLFIEALVKGMQPRTGHSTMGATNFYAIASDGHQVVVIGEVPEATVMQFATAVSFKK